MFVLVQRTQSKIFPTTSETPHVELDEHVPVICVIHRL